MLYRKNLKLSKFCRKIKIFVVQFLRRILCIREPVSMDIIMRICEYFSCDVGDVMEMISREEGEIGNSVQNDIYCRSDVIQWQGSCE